MAAHFRTELMLDALEMALAQRRPDNVAGSPGDAPGKREETPPEHLGDQAAFPGENVKRATGYARFSPGN